MSHKHYNNHLNMPPRVTSKKSHTQKRKLSDQEPISTTTTPSTPMSTDNPQQPYIGTIHDAPPYVKDNMHITGGYRINFDTPKKIFKTLFMAHNETVNIWTHLAGAIFVLLIVIYAALFISPYIYPEPTCKVKTFLNSSSVIQEITEGADHKLQQIKNSLDTIYQEFQNATSDKLHQTDEMIEELKVRLEGKIQEVLAGFVGAKEEFQGEGVKGIVEGVKTAGDSLNSTLIKGFKDEVSYLAQEFINLADSKEADFFDPAHTPNPQFVSRWPIFVFLWTAGFCLMCSAIFHLFYPMSGKWYKFFMRFDYAGINVLIPGSTFPPVYYGLYCNLPLATFYLGLMSSIAITIFTMCLFDWIHKEQNRIWKAIVFGGFGIFVSVPAIHILINQYVFGTDDKFSFVSSVPFLIGLGASYLIGLYVYTVQCPERHAPGKFDLCGHSHQIWHLMVIAGIVFTYLMGLQTFEQRKVNACPASQSLY